jgi:excinuclease ABC subunit A
MSVKELVIKGAKQNNLKDINLILPHDKVIAVTGVSGSGKSSLAFDTIFAEGQWRFIESLSTYARLFLEKLDRPNVEAIENIRPAIALEQRNPVRGSRSTVGTLTELYDFFRLLYSKVATPYCPECGKEIIKWDPSGIVSELIQTQEGRRAFVMFQTDEGLEELKRKGYARVMVEGKARDIDEVVSSGGAGGGGGVSAPWRVVLDRLVIRDEPRLSDSVEMAFGEGRGRVEVKTVDGPDLLFSAGAVCDGCGTGVAEATPLLFSFNHPVGACPECKGFGNILRYSEELVVPDPYLSLSEGAVEPWEKPAARWWKKQMLAGAKSAGIDVKAPYKDLSARHREMLVKGGEDFYGIEDFFEDLEGKRYKLHVRVFLSRYRRGVKCPACDGRRLRTDALSYRIGGLDITELSMLSVEELLKLFRDIDLSPFQKDVAGEILRQISLKLGFLERVGLHYLTLSRRGKTLSGGEYQRVNLSNQLASNLTGTLYVLDEPTVGLHRRDTERISEIMSELSGVGNTIVLVEHDRGMIEGSDWVVELGPGGGRDGGQVVFSGPMEGFRKSGTLTSRYIIGTERVDIPKKRRGSKGRITLMGATGNNLKDVDLEVPVGTLTAVTGVSGSGKSTLIVETLYRALVRTLRQGQESPLPYRALNGVQGLKAVKLIDQMPIGKSPRSNPVTYLKIFDPIRKLFAGQAESKAYGYGPGFFSFNVDGGRCETCRGEGYQKVEMYFFEDLYVRCEGCGGKRYKPETLRVRYCGKNIYEVLEMTVEEGGVFFSGVPQISGRLALMKDVGLGYIKLGQPATTLSGGEAQRLKICAELSAGGVNDVVFVLDEPTVGLHPMDVGALLRVLQRLVDAGNTVLVIEHNLDLIKSADWIIDIGPEGGDKGGEIVFAGTPDEIVRSKRSYTGRYLKGY